MATQIKTGLIANDAITDAKIANVALTGVTASSGDSSTSLATTAFVVGEINSLIDSAPGALNTLNELAAAMGDDANFSTTVTNSIATKLPLAGGTMTGTLAMDAAIDIKSGSAIHGTITTSSNSLTLNARNTGHLIFQSGGNEKMRLNGSNVGIGTGANVDELLHIEKSSGTTLVKTEVAANSVVGLEIKKTGSTTSNWRIVDGQTVNGNLEIYDVTDSRSVMMFDGDGDIGMGVTPATHAKLTLGGTATSYSSVLAFDNNTTGGATFFMLASDNTWSAGGNKFLMGHGGPSSSAVDVTIDADGYVGIGTTSPSRKLDVRGAVRFSVNTSTHETFVFTTQAANDAKQIMKNASSNDTIILNTGGVSYFNGGNVGIGTTQAGNMHTNASKLVVGTGSGDQGMAVFAGTSVGRYAFARAAANNSDTYDGGMSYDGNRNLKFHTNANATRMTIDGSGRVGINRTPALSSSKLEVGGADNVRLIAVEASGHTGGIGINGGTTKSRGLQLFAGANIIATLSNQTNVGYVADGLFGTNARPTRLNCTGSGQMLFGYVDSGSGLYSAAMGMEFDEINGLSQTQWVDGWVMKATVSGTKTLRIETDGDIYNVNGTFSSGSDRRIKKEISDASSQWDDVKAVRVRKFKLGATAPGSPHDHFHIGVIAQEIEEAGMNGLVKETTPDDGHIRFDPSLAGDKIKTVKYSILQMKAFKALQEAMEKIETLEAKVAALEAK